MAKIVEYEAVKEYDPKVFAQKVNRLLADGWRIHGEVAHGHTKDLATGNVLIYSQQFLVRYE